MYQLNLPQSDRHSQVKITIRHPKGETSTTLDDSHKTMNLHLPEGVDIDDVEIIAQFVGTSGEIDHSMKPMLLKERDEKESESEDEPVSEPSSEKADEPPTDDGSVGPVESADGKILDSRDAVATDDAQDDAASEKVGETGVKQEADADANKATAPVTRGRRAK